MIVGPWFANLLISVLYTSLNVVLFVQTNFENLLFYDLSTIVLMWLSILLMANFLYKMHTERLPNLLQPLVIPHPTFICSLVLTVSVTIGYFYIFIYKLALFGCDRAVEAQDAEHLVLDSLLRLTIALYSLLSFIYIIQRSHVGSVNTKFDLLMRNFINCVFGVIWLRFILLKAYFTIEQFCRDQTETKSIVKAFCPPYIQNGFNCSTVSLRKEQQIWYRLHYGLLKSVVVTCASELIPVLIIGHWLACGRAEMVVRKMTMKINAIKALKKFSLKKFSRQTATVTDAFEQQKPIRTISFQKRLFQDCLVGTKWISGLLKGMVLVLALSSIFLWNLSFYNFINDLDEGGPVFTQDTVEVFVALLRFGFFVLLFIWAQQVPPGELELHRVAESRGDKVIIVCSSVLLSAECVCELMELLFFSFNNKRATHLAIKILDIIHSIFSTTSNWLEILCLMKVIAIRDRFLFQQLAGILPFIAVGCTIFNFAEFAMTYFYIETEKHHLKGVIESLESSEFFVLVGVVGRILDTANYLFTFTCALCWIDVLMRYYHSGFFVIGKRSNDERRRKEEEDSEEEAEAYC